MREIVMVVVSAIGFGLLIVWAIWRFGVLIPGGG